MLRKSVARILSFAVVASTLLAACGGAPATPQVVKETVVVKETQVVKETVKETVVAKETVQVEKAVTATPKAVEVPKTKNLRVNIGTWPDMVDPQRSSFTNEITHLMMIYEGLTKQDKDLKTVPGAAESWKFSDDGKTLTFKLRAGLKYSDGKPLTAANFEYSLKRNCDPNVAGEYQSITFEIVGCEEYASGDIKKLDAAGLKALRDKVGVKAVDDTTLEIKLKQLAPYFPTIMGIWVAYPARQDKIEPDGKYDENWWLKAENHVGNGPFMWKTLAEKDKSEFVPNPNYWRGKPKLEMVTFRYINDSAIAFAAYNAGQFDVIPLAPEDLATAQADPQLSKQILIYPRGCTLVMLMNNTKPPMDKKEVRQAFTMAVDRDAWVRDVMRGLGVPTQTWIPPGYPGYKKSNNNPFDPAAAKKKLADAGYPDGKGLPEVKITYASSPRNKTRFEFLASQFKQNLGVNVVLDPVDPTTATALQKDNKTYPQIGYGGWCADYPDPQNWLSVYWKSTTTFAQRIGYKNPEFDKLVDQADVELDATKRAQLYDQAQELMLADSPSGILYNDVLSWLVKPYVTGFQTTPQDHGFPGAMASFIDVDFK